MVYVIVTMQIKKGRAEEFLKLAEELSGFIVKEPGCLAFDFTREVKSPLGIQEPIDRTRCFRILDPRFRAKGFTHFVPPIRRGPL